MSLDLSKIAAGLHLIAEGLDEAPPVLSSDAPEPEKPARKSKPKSEKPAQEEAPKTEKPARESKPAMNFEDFSAQIRKMSVAAGAGKLGPLLQPVLQAFLPDGGGLSKVPVERYEDFLHAVRAAAKDTLGKDL